MRAARRVVASITFGVPAPFAFDFVADPTTATVIDPAVRLYQPDRVPMDVGTTIEIRFRMWGVPVRATSVVHAWEPGRRMVMENVKPARPVRVTAEHRFDGNGNDHGNGVSETSTYTWTIECRPVGVLGRPAAALMSRFWRANATAQQRRLKTAVEARWKATAGGAERQS